LQTITLLSPSGGSPLKLDVLPGSCPNLFAPTTNPGNFVKPLQFTNGDLGSVTANQLGDCNSPLIDGRKDTRLTFSRAALVSQLGLAAEPHGTLVKRLLTGKRTDGRTFAVADQLVIQESGTLPNGPLRARPIDLNRRRGSSRGAPSSSVSVDVRARGRVAPDRSDLNS
jgi:hypothetical protein